MTKCAHCKEPLNVTGWTFSGIPKTKFCHRCWNRIYVLYKAQQYLMKDTKLWDWTLKIRDPNEDNK